MLIFLRRRTEMKANLQKLKEKTKKINKPKIKIVKNLPLSSLASNFPASENKYKIFME